MSWSAGGGAFWGPRCRFDMAFCGFGETVLLIWVWFGDGEVLSLVLFLALLKRYYQLQVWRLQLWLLRQLQDCGTEDFVSCDNF